MPISCVVILVFWLYHLNPGRLIFFNQLSILFFLLLISFPIVLVSLFSFFFFFFLINTLGWISVPLVIVGWMMVVVIITCAFTSLLLLLQLFSLKLRCYSYFYRLVVMSLQMIQPPKPPFIVAKA